MGEPTSVIRLKAGVVVAKAGGVHVVNCDGVELAPAWAGLIPTGGDVVKVLILDGAAIAWNAATGPRPGRGTVAGPASGGLLPITTTAGVLQCMYTGTAPSLNTEVFLDWQMTTPRVLAGTAVVIPPAPAPTPVIPPTPPPPPPPPPQQTGVLEVPAIDARTYVVGRAWESPNFGVRQGGWAGRDYQGGWFYGSQPQQAKGLVVTRFRLRLGARLRVGEYNAPLALRFHVHGHGSVPTGGLSISAGPEVVTIQPGYGGGDLIDLPVSWGQALVENVGGIALTGGMFGGLEGRDSDPNSGFLIFDWRTA